MIGDSVATTGKLAAVGSRVKFEDCFEMTDVVGIVEIVVADVVLAATSAS